MSSRRCTGTTTGRVVKAALILAGMLAVDVVGLLWTRHAGMSGRLAWQRIQRIRIKGDGGHHRDHSRR